MIIVAMFLVTYSFSAADLSKFIHAGRYRSSTNI